MADSQGRWELIRDVLVFQLKLVLDAVRDFALSPLSIGAGVLDLVSGDEPAGRRFYAVLRLGQRAERWLDLYRPAGRLEGGEELPGVDSVVARVEALLAQQVERGGVTAQAKAAIDRSLDALSRKAG